MQYYAVNWLMDGTEIATIPIKLLPPPQEVPPTVA
jgi:hypothetical protein